MDGTSAFPEWSPNLPAHEPFVFRSGGLFGSGKKVMTIGAAIKYMDRQPSDGIYHLQNGTLARWLDDQGAHELARLARDVLNAGYTDTRVMLETFLLGTGLLHRPRIALRPKTLEMGYILSGQSCSHDLSIRKGRGRGYLFGHLHRADPWLSLDPTTFSGRATRIDVTVDTLTLPISQKPQAAQISIESSASEDLLTVPVHFRVMGMPSGLNRYVIRPLLNILVAALIGGGLGLLLALFGVGTPGWLPAVLRLPEAIFWPVVVGLVWVIMAAVRGFLQPLAWPAFYTLGRWLLRTAIWGVTLIVVAAAALWLWRELETQLSVPAPIAWSSGITAAFALAVLPGIGGELWNTRGASDPCAVSRRMPIWRPGLLVLSAVILCALLATGARLLAPSLQTNSASALVGRSEAWSSEQMSRLDVILNRAIDDFFLRLYDRRAPAPTATPVRTPRPAGTPAP